jgi:hypothetical protein
MQKFDEVDGGNPDGTAKDRVGLVAGTTYLAKYWNDNFFNIFNAVTNAGYELIDDDLEQLTKAYKGRYKATSTYNTSGIATQSVNDIVEGSDGLFYEAQSDAINGDDPVGSVTGDWKVKIFEYVARSGKSLAFTFPGDANETLTDEKNTYGRIVISGAVISVQRDLIVNNNQRNITVQNDEAFSVNIKTAAGTGIIVASGTKVWLYCDGTNVIESIDAASDVLPSITGTATFTNSTNNINLTDVGSLIDLEAGDVVQVSGSTTAQNDKEFTVEDITDTNNIVVNFEHRGGTSTKSLIGEVSTANVTVTILSKWYNAALGLGQGWCIPASTRNQSTEYSYLATRAMQVSVQSVNDNNAKVSLLINGTYTVSSWAGNISGADTISLSEPIESDGTYEFTALGTSQILELI